MAKHDGIVYMRTRAKRRLYCSPSETFVGVVAKSHVNRDKDQATVVAAGITLHEALKAYEQL